MPPQAQQDMSFYDMDGEIMSERPSSAADPMSRKPTKADLIEALHNIASYSLPVYQHDGKKMVPLENADYLRTMAKEALAGTS